jgi:DNA-binding CsgD family transcriptional regulator
MSVTTTVDRASKSQAIEERQLRVTILEESGVSERDIARILGVSRSTVRRDIRSVRNVVGTGSLVVSPEGKVSVPNFRRGRVTKDGHGYSGLFSKVETIIEPDDHEADWAMLELDRETLSKVSPRDLLKMMANVSPPFSRAIWDYMRLCDAGHDYKVYKKGTEETDPAATEAFGEIVGRLKERYGSLKAITTRLFMNGYLRGSMLAEIVLNGKREVIDFVVPDAYTARFRLVKDSDLGEYWQLGQRQDGKFVPLEYPTIRYMAHDEWPGSPYGRSPAMPGLFPCLFLIGLMHDLRRVVAQQGYPRIDISIDLEKLAAAFPLTHRKGGDDWDKLIDDTMNSISSVYAALEPEDAFVHTFDSVVNRPVGSLDGNSIQASDTLIRALERMAVQALKTMPLMFGITDGVSEANANRQWEIQAAAVKSLQHMAETILGDLGQVGLEAAGFVCDVKWRFSELRASELQRDEQTVMIRSQNAAFMRDQAWMTEVEAAEYGLARPPSPEVLKELASRPLKEPAPTEPVQPIGTPAQPPGPEKDPDPGENLSVDGSKVVVRKPNGRLLILDKSLFDEPTPEELELLQGVAD